MLIYWLNGNPQALLLGFAYASPINENNQDPIQPCRVSQRVLTLIFVTGTGG